MPVAYFDWIRFDPDEGTGGGGGGGGSTVLDEFNGTDVAARRGRSCAVTRP